MCIAQFVDYKRTGGGGSSRGREVVGREGITFSSKRWPAAN